MLIYQGCDGDETHVVLDIFLAIIFPGIVKNMNSDVYSVLCNLHNDADCKGVVNLVWAVVLDCA